MQNEEYCSGCRFSFEESDGPGTRVLTCHRHAPRAKERSIGTDTQFETIWPAVDDMDWCGEFQGPRA